MLLGLTFVSASSQVSMNYENNQTPEWSEVIALYEHLDKQYGNAVLTEVGTTDAGKPLHLFIISNDRLFTTEAVHSSGKRIILVNNGIHPGESNGIDASIAFASELLSGHSAMEKYLENTVILIVPLFNVGGALNRSAYHRANQNGPVEHGFRGNARNLDLNRDFVKMDSRNAISLAKVLREWDPDILIDTHSTNGADYPYTVTIIPGHPQQIAEPLSSFQEKVMVPYLFEKMNASPYKMSQYVNVFRSGPEKGFEGMFEYPRYLAGYSTFFNILSFTVETHMLKPYRERVLSTKKLLEEVLIFTHNHAAEIGERRQEAVEVTKNQRHHVLQWRVDTSKYDLISFTGYKAKTKMSEVTGLPRTYYDTTERWIDNIPFYNYFEPVVTVEAPDYYIVPAAWREVIERLQVSAIQMTELERDTLLNVSSYYIENYESTREPYNGHYWHYNTEVREEQLSAKLQAGDFIIPVKQPGAAYLVHVLEPQGYDSYFSWNFFDAVLMRMEYFSPYLFEENAAEILNNNKELKAQFNKRREEDPEFRENPYAQLTWIYERSPWSEPTFRRYPVFRYFGEL